MGMGAASCREHRAGGIRQMENAEMRITKSWLRSTKIRLDERIKSVFALPDQKVESLLLGMFPNVLPGTREENVRMILLLSVEEFIPSRLVD